MVQSNKTVITVFTEAFGIYAKHLPTFLKYMSFPVFGQFAGLALSLILPLWLAPVIVAVIGDEKLAFAITMLLSLPGIILFTKAFWEYLVAYVSVCSMAENTVKSGRIYDINAHKKVATMSKRVGSFVTLWLLFGVFTIVAILPPMWFFAAIIFVFISLIFQVFTFEKNLSAAECFKKSFMLVKTNFGGTLLLLLIVGISSYFLLPKAIEIILGILQITKLFTMVLDPVISSYLPIEQWNLALAALNISDMITSLEISKMIISSAISCLVIYFTLPLRSICFTLWYKQLSVNEIKSKSKKKKAKSEDVQV
ncbi:hypothetical protein IJ843_02645 [bacterium]|nr:hypothetical protein [bacterium]